MSSDDVIYCSRHPKVETSLTCASCGTPICPKCMVVAPVGMKCPDCGNNRGGALFQISPSRLILVGVVSLLAGLVAGIIGNIGFFFIFFISVAYGYFAGSRILKISGMKRGRKIEIITGVGMVAGAIALKLISHAGLLGGAPTAYWLRVFADPFFWIAVAISTACAVSKVRYL